MPTTSARVLQAARVKAGHVKFRGHQLLASNAVPLYRRVRSIDAPLAERYLFVLAHPRSGSTVLSRVLQSHDDITGFGEHHEGYDTDADLAALAARNAFFAREFKTAHQYTLDKIVWNHHDIGDALLRRADTRFVFLAREPAATLDSYRRMLHDMPTDEIRLQSYQSRLDGMVGLAKRVGDPERMAFATYDELTTQPAATLDRLTRWLELATPLTPDFDPDASGGSQSWGTPSEHFGAGTIIALPSVEVDTNIDAAQQCYRQSCEALTELTITSQ